MDRFIGKRLDGRYEMQEIIGMGGMANVYKSFDIVEQKYVAVKILKDEYSTNEEFVRRFRNESKAIAMFSHPNIVKVLDVSFGQKIQYIVMEYVDGITLKEYIEQQKVIGWKETIYFTVQILRALQHAHDKGIVHRDIKPQNIMLLQDGTIKVMDFGIARFSREQGRTLSSQAIGSVHYISPEQARADKTDEKTDLYSVGVMMFEMLTGTLPFDADSAVSVALMQLQNTPKKPRELNDSIPEGLEEITERAMQKDPLKRYQSASEMLRDIDMFKRNPSIVFEYKYFNDDKTTKFFDAVSTTKVEEEEEEKSNFIQILGGIAAACVIGAILFIVIMAIINGGKVADVPVPKLVGVNYNTAIKDSKFKDITIQMDAVEYNEQNDAGNIFWQSEKEGTMVKKNYIVKVKVSKGKPRVKIPNIYGKHITDAEEAIKALNLEVKIVQTQSDEVTKDYVIKTLPARDSEVTVNSIVTIYVSSGKEVILREVPNVIDKNLEEAKYQIEQFKFRVGKVTEVDSTKAKGKIVSQSYSGGSKIAEGSTIDISVSTGIPPTNTTTITYSNIPTDASGNFNFKIYVNGELNTAYTKTIDVGSTRSVEFKIAGTGTKDITIKIERSSNEAILAKYSVNFTDDTSKLISSNANAFKYVELLVNISIAEKINSNNAELKTALTEAKAIVITDTATKISLANAKLKNAIDAVI